MANNTWLRLYTEITRDRKLRRIKPAFRWIWIAILCMAKESPIPGRLLLSENIPVTAEDIADEAAVTIKEVNQALQIFEEELMLHKENGIMVVTNWDKRQYESDSSKERVKKCRENKRDETVTSPLQDRYTDVTSPLQDRYSNVTVTAPDTDTESDTDTDKNNPITSSKEDAPARSPKKSSQPYMNHPAVMIYRGVMQLTPKPVLRELIAQKIGDEPEALDRWREACVEWLARAYNPKNIDGLLDFYQNGGKKMPKMSKTAEAYMALAEKFEREEKGD